MNDHATLIQTDDVYLWFECVCGVRGTSFYRFMGTECAEQDAAYHLETASLSEPDNSAARHAEGRTGSLYGSDKHGHDARA